MENKSGSNSECEADIIPQVETKITVKKKLLSGECILIDKKGTSAVWELFKNVVYNNDENVFTGFVACIKCKLPFKYSHSSGTSTLSRHKCVIINTKNDAQTSLDSFVSKKLKTIPDKLKSECIDKSVKFCSMDIRPLSIIDGSGFKELGQFLIKVGRQYGDVDINDLMPHPTTVSKNTIKIAENHRNTLFENIVPFIKDNCCSMTTDMWSDKYKKRHYITITVHYIDINWILRKNVLHTGQWPISEKKTAENIKNSIGTFLTSFECTKSLNANELMKKITFVTDQGPNMTSSSGLGAYNRLNCCAHMLNTVLRHVFDSKFLDAEDENNRKLLEPVTKLLSGAKSFVKFMKTSGEVNKLSKGLIQEVETRWNTRLAMLLSIHEQWDEIINEYGEDFWRLQNIDIELLKQITEFLKPFKTASDELEGDIYPTIHKVLLYKVVLEKHINKYCNLEEDIYDSSVELNSTSIVKKLGIRAREIFNKKFIINRTHEMACFLWPNFKKLKMVSDENEKKRILNNIKLELLKMEIAQAQNDQNVESESIEDTAALNISQFSEWEDDAPKPKQSYEQEMDNYLTCFVGNNVDTDILNFWKSQNEKFPLLSRLARQTLCIPASSASSERVFSVSGRIIEERRSRLKGETVDSLVFLHDFFKNIKVPTT